MAEDILVEVVYALGGAQKLLCLRVPSGTTVREAALRSGMEVHFSGLDLASAPLGIFGKLVAMRAMTPNEVRAAMNLPAIEGGDELANPYTTTGPAAGANDNPSTDKEAA